MTQFGITSQSQLGSTNYMDIENNFTEVGINATCIERKDTVVLVLSVIPITALLFNIVVLIAVILYRSRLKQNKVYIYVFSVLLSNILFNFLSIYQIFNHYYQFEGDPSQEEGPVRGWWVFRKALLIATYLIMVGNMGALIYAIRAGNYIVAKAASSSVSEFSLNENSSVSKVETQRRKAYFLVSAAWLFPVLLALSTLAGWNCSERCECLSGCYTLEDIEVEVIRPCSRVFTAISTSYMCVTVVVWCIEMAILFLMICKTYCKSLLFTVDCLNKNENENNNELRQQSRYNESRNTSHGEQSPVVKASTPAAEIKKSTKSRRVDKRRRRYAKWLRVASKQLTYLTILFFVCTLPAMLCLLIDTFRQEMINSTISSVLLSLVLLYTIICPLILARDLAGLKKALVSLVLKIYPGTKIKAHSGTATYTSSTCSDLEGLRK